MSKWDNIHKATDWRCYFFDTFPEPKYLCNPKYHYGSQNGVHFSSIHYYRENLFRNIVQCIYGRSMLEIGDYVNE